MTYLQRKKLAFMSIVNKVKGFIRTVSGIPPLTLPNCVDDDSLIEYKIYGNSVQEGTPSPNNPVDVVSVGERTSNLWNTSATTMDDLYIPVEAGECYQIEYPSIDVYKTVTLYDENKEVAKKLVSYAYLLNVYSKWIVKPKQNGYLLAYAHSGNYTVLKLMVTKGLTVSLTSQQTTNLENNQFVRADAKTVFPNYEPYGYKIPIIASNESEEPIITNIYLEKPLGEGESISYPEENIPKLPTFKGTTIYEIGTSIEPSNIEVTYYSTQKGK